MLPTKLTIDSPNSSRFDRNSLSDPIGFARRHQTALTGLADRIGLDYFTIDCAENKRGELLIFEADNTAVVHNMDSPKLFAYKPPQMRAIFEAFAAMLYRRSRRAREHAA